MSTTHWIKMTLLAAIWGSSFIFMKILAPAIGAIPTACLRILISGLVLVSGLKLFRSEIGFKKHFKHFLVVGFLNAALPFILYSFAALHAPSSLSVIMNSTTPLFGAWFSLIWLGERLTWNKALGFGLGTAGVVMIALKSSHGQAQTAQSFDHMTLLAAIAGLTAAACYAATGVYIKRSAPGIKPFSLAGASQLFGGLMLLPFALLSWNGQNTPVSVFFQSRILTSLLCLSLICSSLGFMIFYHLVEEVGPTQTLVVGYLIPAFGILWGSLFLGETIHAEMILGTLLILAAVFVISKKKSSGKVARAFEKADLAPIIKEELGLDQARKSTSQVS